MSIEKVIFHTHIVLVQLQETNCYCGFKTMLLTILTKLLGIQIQVATQPESK